MKLINNFGYVLVFVLGFLAHWFLDVEPEVIDNTEHFKAERDSLLYANNQMSNEIIDLNRKITRSIVKQDSLIEYQNKVYVHYENKIADLSHVPDDSINLLFSELVGELITDH